ARIANPAAATPQKAPPATRGTLPSRAPRPPIPAAPAAAPLRAKCLHVSNPQRNFQCAPATPHPYRFQSAPGEIARDSRNVSLQIPSCLFLLVNHRSGLYSSLRHLALFFCSHFFWSRPQNPFDEIGHPIPVVRFRLEPPSARRCEPIILRFALVLRFAPFARKPALMFEPIERRIKRALLNFQPVFRNLLDAQQNPVAVQRAQRHSLENEHVQRPLKKFHLPGQRFHAS